MTDARPGLYNCYSRSNPLRVVNPDTGQLDNLRQFRFDYFMREKQAADWLSYHKASEYACVSFDNKIVMAHNS